MNHSEARQRLQIFRPGGADADDPSIAEALEFARRDTELSGWLEQQTQFHAAMRVRFREIPIPENLRENILTSAKIIRPMVWWRDPGWLRAVASVVLFVGLCYGLVQLGTKAPTRDGFSDYQFRMVRSALREYKMDLVTNDLAQVRQWMTSQKAPADFAIPPGLSKLVLTGGGVLRWRNNPVSMVCFNRGDDQMLFLFVMNRAAVKDPPPLLPELAQVSQLQTIRWSEGNKTYFLAGPKEDDFVRKYF